jgi:hypothetical protein
MDATLIHHQDAQGFPGCTFGMSHGEMKWWIQEAPQKKRLFPVDKAETVANIPRFGRRSHPIRYFTTDVGG